MIPLEIRERVSPNHGPRGEPARIDMLVLHYTGMKSAEAAIERLCDPNAKVSAHYVVEENGGIWRLVPEARRAFHAGISCWEGESALNTVSLGIEIVNSGHEWGYRPFPEEQMASVETLCRDLVSRYSIPPHRIVGHSDIAPERKSDPGELFDWPRLARAGIGIWPPVNLVTSDRRRRRARRSSGDRLLRYRAVTDPDSRRLSAPLSAAVLRRPARCRNCRAPIEGADGFQAITSGLRRALCVKRQSPLQALQVDRAVPDPR
jgi:N-acetylmuramoyl-L-alanine amidase